MIFPIDRNPLSWFPGRVQHKYYILQTENYSLGCGLLISLNRELRGFCPEPAVLIKHLIEQRETKRHSDKIVAKRSLEFTTSSEEQIISNHFFLFNTEKFHVTSFIFSPSMVVSNQQQQLMFRYFTARA